MTGAAPETGVQFQLRPMGGARGPVIPAMRVVAAMR
jgi:hypothetical protein